MSQIGTVCFQKHKDKGKTFHPLHDRGIYHLIVQMSICVATPEKEKVTRTMMATMIATMMKDIQSIKCQYNVKQQIKAKTSDVIMAVMSIIQGSAIRKCKRSNHVKFIQISSYMFHLCTSN